MGGKKKRIAKLEQELTGLFPLKEQIEELKSEIKEERARSERMLDSDRKALDQQQRLTLHLQQQFEAMNQRLLEAPREQPKEKPQSRLWVTHVAAFIVLFTVANLFGYIFTVGRLAEERRDDLRIIRQQNAERLELLAEQNSLAQRLSAADAETQALREQLAAKEAELERLKTQAEKAPLAGESASVAGGNVESGINAFSSGNAEANRRKADAPAPE